MSQIPVIFDCDSTFGIPGCDVDDGLALLYLLGCPTVDLLGAQEIHGDFFSLVHTGSLMGGLTEPLFVGGHPMDELNLSCDSTASHSVIRHAQRVMIATAQNCLTSFFLKSECEEILRQSSQPIARYLEKHISYRFDLNERDWDIHGGGAPITVTLPRIQDQPAYVRHIYSAYLSARVTPCEGIE